MFVIRGAMNIYLLAIFSLLFPLTAYSQGELQAPTILGPPSGSVIQLSEPPQNVVTLQWSIVEEATGYFVDLSGPEGFTGREVIIDETEENTFEIFNLITGTYTWTVSAITAEMMATSPPSFFTIQVGPLVGGDLPAPALLLPPDFSIVRGNNVQIDCQWTRVTGAASYAFQFGGQMQEIPQPVSGDKVTAIVPFLFPGSHTWKVTPKDELGVQSTENSQRQLLFTSFTGEPWDLDSNTIPSPGDVFAFSENWQDGFTISDFNQDGDTNGGDAALLISSQQTGALPSPTPIPGFLAPIVVGPLSGSQLPPGPIPFAWEFLIGAAGYEFCLVRDDGFTNTRIIAQPEGGGNVSTTFNSVQQRDEPYIWRVRAFFGSGTSGPPTADIVLHVSN